MSATYEYGTRGDMPPVKMTWHQVTAKPPQFVEKKIPQWDSAALFVGHKGMLLADYGKHVLLPETDFKEDDCKIPAYESGIRYSGSRPPSPCLCVTSCSRIK